MSKALRKKLLLIAGFASTGLGILGIVLPVLPTTPFLLLAAACFARSSERFHRWLLNNRWLGGYIRNYTEGRGMPVKHKVSTLVILWAGIGVSAYLIGWNPVVIPLLIATAAAVSWHIIHIRPKNPGPGGADSDVFNAMAPGWYNVRHRTIFRDELADLARRWQKGKLLNIGCAHGPDFLPFREGFELHGMDISPAMLEMARKYAAKYSLKVDLKEADARKLPYGDNSFDFAIAVAVFHHIKDEAGRLTAFRELDRVLKPGGEAFVTVWNRWQPRFWFSRRDVLVPWKDGDKVYSRYYHLFSYGELAGLAGQAGLEKIRIFPEKRHRFPLKHFSRNICLLLRKPADAPAPATSE